MKIFVIMVAAAGILTGCVGYAVPYSETPVYGSATIYQGHDGRTHRGARDRDHDGVRDRVDRDRDGDGVRNREDRRPDNPYRN